MNTKTHNKNRILPKTAISLTALLLASLMLNFIPGLLLAAEDYPSGFLGPGYREYLSGKIVDGYYVDAFAKLDTRLQTRVEKRNQIEDILNTSYKATPETNYGILKNSYEIQRKNEGLTEDIAKARQERESSAAGSGTFYYTTFEDGRTEYYKDGLVIRIENEPVYDEFGNESRKNTYNIKYNDRRLMVSYDATVTNAYGDVTKIRFEGAEYTDDSVFYGSNGTNANRLFTKYRLTEIDAAGNVTVTEWKADGYEGKCLQGFVEERYSDIYGYSYAHRYNIVYETGDYDFPTSYEEEGTKSGASYHLIRTNITYETLRNGDNPILSAYHEVYTDEAGNKTTSDVALKYTDDLLQESNSTTLYESTAGSIKTETAKVVYTYGENGTLVKAVGYINGTQEDLSGTNTSIITGEDTYQIIHGRAQLTRAYRRSENSSISGEGVSESEQTFTYDEWGLHLSGSSGSSIYTQFSATGSKTVSYSQDTYDIIYGEAKLIESVSQSYEFGLFGDNEEIDLTSVGLGDINSASLIESWQKNCDAYTTNTKTYSYYENGRLEAVAGESIKNGRDDSGNVYTTTITDNYRIENNQAILDTQEITTTGQNTLSLDTWIENEILKYTYGAAKDSNTGRSATMALLSVENLEVTVDGTTFAGTVKVTTDKDGARSITTTTNTYEVRFGEILLPLSKSVTASESLTGTFTQTTTIVVNNYDWVTFNGEQKYLLASQNYSISSEGRDINGNTWETTTPETYALSMEECEYNGRQYWGVAEGTLIESQSVIARSDVYGNERTETRANKYEVKFGKPLLQEAISVSEGTNQQGVYTKETTTTTYAYGWVSFGGEKYYTCTSYTVSSQSVGEDIPGGSSWTTVIEPYTLTYQECTAENGSKYWGLPEGYQYEVASVTNGVDAYGHTYTENTTSTYEVKFGVPFIIKQVSIWEKTTPGDPEKKREKDKNYYTKTTTTTEYTYGWITFEGEQYYGLVSTKTSKVSEGYTTKGDSDKQTGEWSTSAEEYTLTYQECTAENGSKYWGLPEGMTFTTTYTQERKNHKTEITNEYEIKFGSPILLKTSYKKSSTVNNYGWFSFRGQTYWGLVSQDYKFGGKEIHLDLGEQTYEGTTYWGLKEGKVEGQKGTEVLWGSVEHRSGGGGGSHRRGKLLHALVGRRRIPVAHLTPHYKDGVRVSYTATFKTKDGESVTVKFPTDVKYTTTSSVQDDATGKILEINGDYGEYEVVNAESANYGYLTYTDQDTGASYTVYFAYEEGAPTGSSQTVTGLPGVPEGAVVRVDTDFVNGTVTISILDSDNNVLFAQNLNLEYEDIAAELNGEQVTLEVPEVLDINTEINGAAVDLQLYWTEYGWAIIDASAETGETDTDVEPSSDTTTNPKDTEDLDFTTLDAGGLNLNASKEQDTFDSWLRDNASNPNFLKEPFSYAYRAFVQGDFILSAKNDALSRLADVYLDFWGALSAYLN